MRSIRTTLLASFLALAALVLGGIAWYVYAVTEQTLRDGGRDTVKHLNAIYEQRCLAAKERFDDELVRRALQIASRTQMVRGGRSQEVYGFANAVLLGLPTPAGAPLVLWPTAAVMPAHPFWGGWMRYWDRLCVADDLLPRESDSSHSQEVEYCRLYNENLSLVQYSTTLGSRHLPEPHRAECEKLGRNDWLLEDFDQDGQHLRRLVFKGSISTRVVVPARITPRPSNSTRQAVAPRPTGTRDTLRPTSPARDPQRFIQAPPPRDPPAMRNFATPMVYVEYVRTTDHREQELMRYAAELQEDTTKADVQTQEVLSGLRWRLALVLGAAFLLVALGGGYLVARGLAPLGRLTEAVSQVSERDFDLKLPPEQVPVELVPIVTRLQGSLTSLEKAFAHEKQAVADISHELRTPIASLVTTIQVCLKKPRSSEEYQSALQNCAEIGDHLHDLVQRLLTLARLDAGVDRVQSELIDLADLGQSSLDLVRPLAEAKGLTVTKDFQRGVLIDSDPAKVREVITNLLSNAVQYNRPNGRLELRISKAGTRAAIEVADTGIGINEEVRAHLFERFYRADPSRHAECAHAGLGLAIVKGYLDLLGGSITVDSQPGQGSTFRVLLPLATAPSAEETVVDSASMQRVAS